MARNEPSEADLKLSRPGSLAGLYLRVATTLEQSAELARQHAARLSHEHRKDQVANAELERAERARAAARRCRDLAKGSDSP